MAAAPKGPPPVGGEEESSGRAWRARSAESSSSIRSPRLDPCSERQLALLDRDVYQVAPLRPGAVVVLDGLVAEELAKDEPRVGAPLADPAVGRTSFSGVTPLPS